MAALRRLGTLSLPVWILVLFGGVWGLIAQFYPPEQFPGPAAMAQALLEVAMDGTLWTNTWISLARFAGGYLLAVVVAIPFGLLLGRFLVLQRLFDPLIQVMRPISPIAWFPLAVLWFGIGNAPAIYIIYSRLMKYPHISIQPRISSRGVGRTTGCVVCVAAMSAMLNQLAA